MFEGTSALGILFHGSQNSKLKSQIVLAENFRTTIISGDYFT